jgi:hypothetical protein
MVDVAPQSISNAHRAALSAFKTKMIIQMILEPKHKNLKGQNKIKQQIQKFFNIRRHILYYIYTNGF